MANPPLPEDRRPFPSPEARELAKDIDFAIDLTIPREAMLRRFEELLDTFARAVAREAGNMERERLLAVLPVSEAHGHCFCDGPDRIGRHLDWCPALILAKFDELRARAAQQETPMTDRDALTLPAAGDGPW